MKNKVSAPDEFRWIAFRKDKVITFSLGETVVEQTIRKGTRIRVLATNSKFYSGADVVSAMGWSATLAQDDFDFVVAPKPVIESFPAPFDGVLQFSRWDGSRWIIPKYFNGIPVLGNNAIKLPASEKKKPVVRLSLNRGVDKRLFYEVASFAIE